MIKKPQERVSSNGQKSLAGGCAKCGLCFIDVYDPEEDTGEFSA